MEMMKFLSKKFQDYNVLNQSSHEINSLEGLPIIPTKDYN
jgi:hypothetical protein